MEIPIVYLFLILSPFFNYQASAQILKRHDDIAGWALREEKIFELSKSRVKRLKTELMELEKFVDDYEKTTSRHISGIEDPELQETLKTNEEARAYLVASNPLLTYRMTHRLSTMVTRMQRAVLSKDPDGQELKQVLGAFTDLNQHPNDTLEPVGDAFGQYFDWLPIEDDLEGALDSMIVLYDVYNPEVLDPKNFAAMLSTDTSKPVQINAYHATKFSLKSFYHGYYGNALDWAAYANDKLENERDYSISKELVHYMKEFMGKSHNEEIAKPTTYFPETISYLNFFTEMINETKSWTKRRSELLQLQALGLNLPYGDETVDETERQFQLTTAYYYSACQKARLEQLKNESIDLLSPPISKLNCYLSRDINPFYYLAPLKAEILSEFPRIVQFYEILPNSELEAVLGEVKGQDFRSPYILREFPDEFGTRKPHLRLTMDALLDKRIVNTGGNTGILRTLTRKIEYLTGFQILDYGYWAGWGAAYPGERYNEVGLKVSELVGGGYEAFRRREKGAETGFGGGIQIVLQSPREGGELVFGGAEIIAKPVTGSAILWENIGRDNKVPVDVYVGSCPVAQGHKIVLSKEFLYSLDKFAIF